jgi:hypothetical protein
MVTLKTNKKYKLKNNMKRKKTIQSLIASAALALASVAPAFAQQNLGADCGCPPVTSRPVVNISSLPGFVGGELTQGAILTCQNNYLMDVRTFVPANQTLVIQPGTVVRGKFFGTPATEVCLVIERGGKIMAAGTESCPIVFTAENDLMDNAYPIANKAQWGGILIAGRATNNLKTTPNGPVNFAGKLCVTDGVGIFEGFGALDAKLYHGADLLGGQSFDDNDNSGIMRYVSIRYAGSNLTVGSEINGLTLGSVGRGTTIEHIDIVSCGDDAIEFFGGTVNVKYISALFGNDDMFDWDDGYTGKMQFLFGLKTDNTASVDADNGFECDADDQKSNLLPRSHPVIFNATIIGNNKTTTTSDNSAIAAINAKELTEGEITNSVFANYKIGYNMTKTLGTRTGASEAYHNWAATGGNGTNSLKVKCNTFVNTTNAITVDVNPASVIPSDLTQFNTTDLNNTVASVPGFDYAFAVNNTTNVISHSVDAVPNPALTVTGCPVAPVDGFFSPAPYRGAFASTGKNWLTDYSYAALLQAASGLQPCPTDINADGITNNSDFLILLGQFNQSCH